MEEHRTQVSTAASRAQYEEEVSLAEYLVVLWRYRFVLLLAVVAAVAAVVLIDWNRPSVYQATSRLMISAARPGDLAPPPTLGVLQTLVTSQTLISRALDELGLSKPPHNLSVEDAIRQVSVRPLADASLLEVTARLGDPDLAARFANRLAEGAATLASKASLEDAEKVRDAVKQQLDGTRTRLDEAEKSLAAFRRTTSVEALQAEVDAVMKERTRLFPLLVAIEAERASIQQITTELSKIEAVRDRPSATVPRTPLSEREGSSSPPLRVREDALNAFVNPVFDSLQQQLSESRARLSALEKERAVIASETNVSNPIARRVYELHARRTELDRLEMERDLAKKVYLDVSNRYEQALLQTGARAPHVQVMDRAVPSNTRISPRPLRDAVAAAAAALIATAAVILLLTAVRSHIRA